MTIAMLPSALRRRICLGVFSLGIGAISSAASAQISFTKVAIDRPVAGGMAYEESAQRAAGLLVANGYANVAAIGRIDCLLITYENARYRDARRALRNAVELLSPLLHDGQDLVLVPTYRSIALLTARFGGPRAAGAGDPEAMPEAGRASYVTLDVATVPSELLDSPRASSSFGRMDVVVHPWFQAVFGDYGNPVASRTGVAPEFRVDVRSGLSVSAQVMVTLQDDLPSAESRVRPGLVTVNQTVRLPRNVFVSATAGLFNPDRYGADVETRVYFSDGRISAGVQLGLTGSTSYAPEGWRRTPMRDETALVDVTWHGMPYDLLFRATGGAFLADERGVRLDVSRRFGELEIGWFLLASEDGSNGGLVLTIPLLPASYGRPGPIRVRPAETYRWQYRYQSSVPGGRRYQTGGELDRPPLFPRTFAPATKW